MTATSASSVTHPRAIAVVIVSLIASLPGITRAALPSPSDGLLPSLIAEKIALPLSEENLTALRPLLKQWLQQDPSSASAWITTVMHQPDQIPVTARFISEWLAFDSTAAETWILSQERSEVLERTLYQAILLLLEDRSPSHANRLSGLLTDESLRLESLPHILRVWWLAHPTEASTWLASEKNTKTPEQSQQTNILIAGVADQLFDQDITSAYALLSHVDDPELWLDTSTSMMFRWADRQPDKAYQSLQKAVASPYITPLRLAYIQGVIERDADAALRVLNELSDPAVKNQVAKQLLTSLTRKSSDGEPVRQEKSHDLARLQAELRQLLRMNADLSASTETPSESNL